MTQQSIGDRLDSLPLTRVHVRTLVIVGLGLFFDLFDVFLAGVLGTVLTTSFGFSGAQLPLVNGFPLRLVVPGWFSTYWVKMLNDIEVLDQPDTNYWMATAYKIPDTPGADMRPGETGVPMVPINKMVPRSFVTNLRSGASVPAGAPALVRGIAFGGDCGVARVDISIDGGKTWQPTQLGIDAGKYGFRQWQTRFTPPASGKVSLMVRGTNENGQAQPATPNWNPSGFMRNVIESIDLIAA